MGKQITINRSGKIISSRPGANPDNTMNRPVTEVAVERNKEASMFLLDLQQQNVRLLKQNESLQMENQELQRELEALSKQLKDARTMDWFKALKPSALK